MARYSSAVSGLARGDYDDRHHKILSRITELTLELSDLKLELSHLEKGAVAKRHRAYRSRDTESAARGSLSELEEGSEIMRRELIRMRAEIEEKRKNNEALLREIAKMKEKLKIKPRLISGYDVAGKAAVSDWLNVNTPNKMIGQSDFITSPTPSRLTRPILPTNIYPSVSGEYQTHENFAESSSYLGDKFRKTTSLMNADPKFRPSDWESSKTSGTMKAVYRPSLSTVESKAFRHNYPSYPTYPIHY